MKTWIAVALVLIVILAATNQTFALTGKLQPVNDDGDDPSLVINRPVNIQGLTGLIITNSAYTQPRGGMVIGLSALAENSASPNFSMLQEIATITGGITDRIELGAKARLIETGLGSSASREVGFGDTDLACKWRVSSAGDMLPAIALGLELTLPTGDSSRGLSEIKQEGVRLMVIGSSETEMPGDYVFGVYGEGQIVLIDQLHRTSLYADKYGVVNAGVLFSLTDDRRLQAIVEYNQVFKKDVLTLYDQNFTALMPGLRYVTPNLNVSFGVQILNRDQADAKSDNRYVGTISYKF